MTKDGIRPSDRRAFYYARHWEQARRMGNLLKRRWLQARLIHYRTFCYPNPQPASSLLLPVPVFARSLWIAATRGQTRHESHPDAQGPGPGFVVSLLGLPKAVALASLHLWPLLRPQTPPLSLPFHSHQMFSFIPKASSVSKIAFQIQRGDFFCITRSVLRWHRLVEFMGGLNSWWQHEFMGKGTKAESGFCGIGPAVLTLTPNSCSRTNYYTD